MRNRIDPRSTMTKHAGSVIVRKSVPSIQMKVIKQNIRAHSTFSSEWLESAPIPLVGARIKLKTVISNEIRA